MDPKGLIYIKTMDYVNLLCPRPPALRPQIVGSRATILFFIQLQWKFFAVLAQVLKERDEADGESRLQTK